MELYRYPHLKTLNEYLSGTIVKDALIKYYNSAKEEYHNIIKQNSLTQEAKLWYQAAFHQAYIMEGEG